MTTRSRSAVWDYFSKVPNDSTKAKCNLCATVLTIKNASTSNLSRHFKLKHPLINLEASRKRKFVDEDDVIDKVNAQANENDGNSAIHPSSSTVNQLKQVSISSYCKKPLGLSKRQSIDNGLLKFIISDYQPFSVVDSEHFKNFVNLLNPNYEMPSRKTLSNSLLFAAYEKCVNKVKTEVENVFSIAITTDGWTSLNNASFYAITGHFIDHNCILHSRLLSTFKFSGAHTSENIVEQLKSALSEWEIENKIVGCVTDNASNMVKAVNLGNWSHVPCFAHSLNLVVQASLHKIKCLTQKAKVTVEFFKRSSSALEKLQNVQKSMGCEVLKLKQDCPTRWNSTFELLNRLKRTKEPIQSTIAILNNASLPVLTREDWYIIETCCDILSVFNDITIEISAEKNVSISKVAVLSKHLINYCHRLNQVTYESTYVTSFVTRLYDEVTTRFKKKYRRIEIIWEATFLDPRFRQHGFHEDDIFTETKDNIVRRCTAIKNKENNKRTTETLEPATATTSGATTSFNIWSDFDNEVEKLIVKTENSHALALIEVEKYLQMPLLPRASDPLKWWKENKHIFPSLYKIMETRLCIPATSVPCERIFSKTGQIITDRRNRISAAKTSKLVFLNFNINFVK